MLKLINNIIQLDERISIFIFKEYSKLNEKLRFVINKVDFFGTFKFVFLLFLVHLYNFIFYGYKKEFLFFIISISLVTMVVFFIKNTFKRKRIAYDNSFYMNKVDPNSFPSGHISRLYVLFFLFYYNNLFFTLIFLVISIIISLIRIGKGAHYLLDCIVGALIGYFVGWTTLWILSFFKM